MVGSPFPALSGGGFRARESLIEYSLRGFEPILILPYDEGILTNLKPLSRELAELKKFGVRFGGIAKAPNFSHKSPFLKRTLKKIEMRFAYSPKVSLKDENIRGIISLHECENSIITAYKLAAEMGVKKLAILQLPPFYGDRRRRRNLERAWKIWTKVIYGVKTYTYNRILRKFTDMDFVLKRILSKFDLLISVSKSIPLEMGCYWSNMAVLNPGIGFTEAELRLIRSLRHNIKHKRRNLVIFSARLVAEKGVLDALYVISRAIKRFNNLRLLIAGRGSGLVISQIRKLAKRLNIEKAVRFLGYISKDELLRLKAESYVMIYPSHADSISFSVLETLALGTPVLAYDIPALKINYSDYDGITLVKEFDIDAMSEMLVNLLNNPPQKVSMPEWRWEDAIGREIELISKCLST